MADIKQFKNKDTKELEILQRERKELEKEYFSLDEKLQMKYQSGINPTKEEMERLAELMFKLMKNDNESDDKKVQMGLMNENDAHILEKEYETQRKAPFKIIK